MTLVSAIIRPSDRFMRRLWTVASFLMVWGLGMLTSIPAHADQFYDGNRLYAICTSLNNFDQVQCIGYVEGIVDMLGTIPQGSATCFPAQGVVAKQVQDIVTQFLAINPALRSDSAAWLSWSALNSAFPCPKAQ